MSDSFEYSLKKQTKGTVVYTCDDDKAPGKSFYINKSYLSEPYPLVLNITVEIPA